MGKRILSAIRGLASVVLLAAVLVGPPMALVRFVGNPLPSTVPSIEGLNDALTARGVSDEVVINTLAVLAWIIWAQLAIAILVEATAQLRRRPTPHLPAFPGCQALAGNLVAGVVLLGSLFNPSRADATQPEFSIPQRHPIAQVERMPPERESAPASAPSPKPEQPTTTYVVERHDSLWSIAETSLGDGMRWREIRDLNIGRPQPDGRALRGDSDVIQPGWTLVVPAVKQPAHPSPTTHNVQPGDHLWKIAEDTLSHSLGRPPSDAEIDPYWRELVEQNRPTLPDPSNPNLIHPGHQVQIPPIHGVDTADVGQPVPEAQIHPSPPPTPPPSEEQPGSNATTPDDAGPATPTSDLAREEREQPIPAPSVPGDDEDLHATSARVSPGVLGSAAGGLAAAIVFQIRRRRRNAIARAPVGATTASVPDHLEGLQRTVAIEADPTPVTEAQAALLEVAEHTAKRRSQGPRPRLVQVGDDHIDVLLSIPDVEPPKGWTIEASGAAWRRPRATEATATDIWPAPLLATIGQADDAPALLYDLEAAGLTVVSGDDDASADFVRSALRELIHGQADLHVVTVGNVPTVAHDRHEHADSINDIADELLALATVSADSLAAHKLPSAFAARGSGRSLDGLVPLLVLCDDIPDDDRFDKLVDLAESGAAVAVLVHTDEPIGRGTDLIITRSGDASVPSLGLDFQPQGISEQTADALDELIDEADSPLTADDAQPGPARSSTATVSANGAPYQDPEYEVLVRVLGQISVEGGKRPLKARQVGLLTYIATHPNCSAEKLLEAIWPGETDDRRNTMHGALSRLRRYLGAEHLPSMGDTSGYRVADSVRADLDLFERRVKYAATKPANEAIEILRGALDLVTGVPFTYGTIEKRSFTWVDIEEVMYRTELLVIRAAAELVRLCTDVGDSEGAAWAARQGLLASPTNSELTCLLMKAHLAAGEVDTAQHVFDCHANALEHMDLGEPDDAVLELWEQLEEDRSR